MESHCRHCGGQLPEAGGLFCPFCKKAIVAFDPPTEPTPMEMWAPPPVYSEEKLERDRPRARLLAILVSVTIYLMIFTTEYSHFDRRQQAKLEKAFGREPLGMTPWVFAWSLGTLVCVPFPMVLYHFGLVTRQSFRDGLSPLGISGFLYLFETDPYRPLLNHSKAICRRGLAYFAAIGFAWIVYTAVVGI
jgi:hypothetical protein